MGYSNHPAVCYVFGFTDGQVKVGVSSDTRFRAYGVRTSYRKVISQKFETDAVPGNCAYRIEKAFKDKHVKDCAYSEVYNLNFEQAVQSVRSLFDDEVVKKKRYPYFIRPEESIAVRTYLTKELRTKLSRLAKKKGMSRSEFVFRTIFDEIKLIDDFFAVYKPYEPDWRITVQMEFRLPRDLVRISESYAQMLGLKWHVFINALLIKATEKL